MATKTTWERGTLPCVAAGNFGPALGTMSHLALSPWALSVGAVDSTGAVLESSRGVDESGGPDLSAPTALTPMSTRRLRVRASLRRGSLAGGVDVRHDQVAWRGVPRSRRPSPSAFIGHRSRCWTRGGRTTRSPSVSKSSELNLSESSALSMMSPPSIYPASRSERWCAEVRAELTAVGLEFEGEASPSYVKRLLLLAAQLVSDGDQSRGGRRVVSEDLLRKFYGSFTPSIFYRFCGTSDSLTERQADLLHRLDLELGSFWDEPAMFVVWNFCHLIDLHNLKVVAGYGRKDP